MVGQRTQKGGVPSAQPSICMGATTLVCSPLHAQTEVGGPSPLLHPLFRCHPCTETGGCIWVGVHAPVYMPQTKVGGHKNGGVPFPLLHVTPFGLHTKGWVCGQPPICVPQMKGRHKKGGCLSYSCAPPVWVSSLRAKGERGAASGSV